MLDYHGNLRCAKDWRAVSVLRKKTTEARGAKWNLQKTCHKSVSADIIVQMPETDDIALLKQYAQGDESVFTALFERYAVG